MKLSEEIEKLFLEKPCKEIFSCVGTIELMIGEQRWIVEQIKELELIQEHSK